MVKLSFSVIWMEEHFYKSKSALLGGKDGEIRRTLKRMHKMAMAFPATHTNQEEKQSITII